MKHLIQYIKEGLFDVEKNVTDTHELEKNMFEDPESDFWKYCEVCQPGSSTPMQPWMLEKLEKEIDIDKETITIPTGYVHLNTRVSCPLVNKYDLICKEFFIGGTQSSGPHPEPVTNGGGFKTIRCGKAVIDGMVEKMDGFNFIVDQELINSSATSFIINWASDLDYAKININNPQGDNRFILSLRGVYDFPNIKNITSNTRRIGIYDSSFFDQSDIKSKLDNFFGDGKIKSNGVVKNKSIRNIVAMINNVRKYGALKPEYFTPVGSLSDLLDLRGFKNISNIYMKNNNVKLTFINPNSSESKGEIERYAKYIRLNNLKEMKDTPLNDIIDMVKNCKTKDGWVVMFEPEQFG